MRFLFIGQNSDGTTSRMRAEKLRGILKGWEHDVIDIHIPFYQTNRLLRSFGFRFKRGPLISAVNRFVHSNLKYPYYDLVWVDKGVFISKAVTAELRRRAEKLVHYTPDAAFFENRSRHFYGSLGYYDFVITTKSYERECYLALISAQKFLVVSQAFDKDIHKPWLDFSEKDNAVVFIGLCEPSREELVQALIESGIRVKLVGKKWKPFVRKTRSNQALEYLGSAIWGEDYAKLISSGRFALGLLSKRFPELHTTRTFEIPACGTALLTEWNEEIASFYEEDEVIFYNSIEELIEKVRYFEENIMELKQLTDRGMRKVNEGGFDYETILTGLLERVLG